MKTLRILALILVGALVFPSSDVRARSGPAGADKPIQAAIHPPAIIFLIRHAEKPAPEENSMDLSPAGVQRAQLLPSLFLPAGSKPARFPRPDVLFATKMSKHSNREVDTLLPLSLALHLPIQHDYEDAETSAVANEILSGKYTGKVVLICWHHGQMPALARALGVLDAPSKIKDSVFDQVWRVEWIDGKPRFSAFPQQLMPGDGPI